MENTLIKEKIDYSEFKEIPLEQDFTKPEGYQKIDWEEKYNKLYIYYE